MVAFLLPFWELVPEPQSLNCFTRAMFILPRCVQLSFMHLVSSITEQSILWLYSALSEVGYRNHLLCPRRCKSQSDGLCRRSCDAQTRDSTMALQVVFSLNPMTIFRCIISGWQPLFRQICHWIQKEELEGKDKKKKRQSRNLSCVPKIKVKLYNLEGWKCEKMEGQHEIIIG